MAEMQKRMTVRKIRIKDIAGSRFVPSPGTMQSSYIITPQGMKASRVRVMGVAVEKFVSEDKNYAFIVVDDGSAVMRVKSFGSTKMLEAVNPGKLVDIIGKIKEYNGEMYVIPEIVKTADDPNLETLRRLELLKIYTDWKAKMKSVEGAMLQHSDIEALKTALKGKVDPKDVENIAEALRGVKEAADGKKEDEGSARAKILELLSSMDKGSGVNYRDIFAAAKLDEKTTERVITGLLEDGICYEPKPGQLKKC